MLFIVGCSVQVKDNVNPKPVVNGIVEKDEIDEYEMISMESKQLAKMGEEKLKKLKAFLSDQLADALVEKEKRDVMAIQVSRKRNLLMRIDVAETLQTKDYLKLLPKIKVEQRPYDTYDSYGDPIKKTENFYGFEVDLSKAFDLFDVSGNRSVEKEKARWKVKTLYFEIKRMVEKRAYYKDMAAMYEKQLESRDIKEQKEAREKLPQMRMLVKDMEILIAEKELEQEYVVLELKK